MKTLLELFGLAFLGVIAYSIYGVFSAMPSTSCSQTEAELKVRAIVRNELKTPSSASFGSRRVQEFKDCTFRFDGIVDAQNNFGATVRSRYVVTVQNIDGKWVKL